MAFVSIGSQLVLQGTLVQNVQEGRAVKFTASGAHRDLPNVVAATVGDTNVFVALASVDNFARPTRAGLFQYESEYTNALSWLPVDAAASGVEFVDQAEVLYNVGPSMMRNPTLLSGWKVTLHKGGCYALMSGSFDNALASVQGSSQFIKVWSGGVFTAATSAADNAVGYVREFRDGLLYVVLDNVR